MSSAEHKEQLSAPRSPSKGISDGISNIVQEISSKGGRRRASIEMDHEQMARIQQHIMSTDVAHDLRRKVAAGEADAAADLEQHQRATQHFIESEVNTELRRAVAGKEATKAAVAEHNEQMASPRRPSKAIADGISDIVSAIASKGGRRRASIEMNHEQMARIQQHIMSTDVAHDLRRKVAAGEADAAADLEQHQRATQHFIESEVNTELRRTVAGKEATKAAVAEHNDQIASPRKPSKDFTDGLVGVIESIARDGSSRRASMEASHEQTARIQQHIMATEVAHDLRRKVAAGEADTAMELERHQRTSQHHIESEVNQELRRTVAGKDASDMAAAEHKEQIVSPRTPSKEIADGIANVVQAIAPIGNRRRASIEMDHEQVARTQQHIMSTEVAHDLRRKVAADTADTATELERHQRTSQHHMESEVNGELRRTVAAKEADVMMAAEQSEQIAAPRRPSKEMMDAKSAINYAIDGAVMVSSG